MSKENKTESKPLKEVQSSEPERRSRNWKVTGPTILYLLRAESAITESEARKLYASETGRDMKACIHSLAFHPQDAQ